MAGLRSGVGNVQDETFHANRQGSHQNCQSIQESIEQVLLIKTGKILTPLKIITAMDLRTSNIYGLIMILKKQTQHLIGHLIKDHKELLYYFQKWVNTGK